MPQHQLLDVFGELAAPTPGQQPQHSRTGEIGEGKEHVPLLSPPGRQRRQGRAPSAGAPATPSKRQHDLVLARARESVKLTTRLTTRPRPQNYRATVERQLREPAFWDPSRGSAAPRTCQSWPSTGWGR